MFNTKVVVLLMLICIFFFGNNIQAENRYFKDNYQVYADKIKFGLNVVEHSLSFIHSTESYEQTKKYINRIITDQNINFNNKIWEGKY